MELYTIAEIARRLQIPESTVRYYRDRYPEYVPSIGEGRNRRYPPEALEALRAIAETVRAGVPDDIIRDMLHQRFPITVNPQDPQQHEATPQQQDTALRKWIENAVKDAVKDVVQDMVKKAVAEALEERDRRMLEALEKRQKVLDEALAELREQAKRKRWRWWWS